MYLFDNTKISAFKACPRYYYFRHVRHWRRAGTMTALAAGLGWHNGMDFIWKGLQSGLSVTSLIDGAIATWEATMREEGIDIDAPEFALEEIRNYGTFKEMFRNYIMQRKAHIQSIELLAIERPFAVPLGNLSHVCYIGRWDKVFRQRNDVFIVDHKTTSLYAKAGPFRSMFTESFSPNSQIDGYLFSGGLVYSDLKGVWIDAALVHKTVHDGFRVIPILRNFSMLDSWLWETQTTVLDILREYDRLFDTTSSAPFLPAFRKNAPSACYTYNRACQYKDLCQAWPNPIGRDMPADFVWEKWEPFDTKDLESLNLADDEIKP